MVHIYTYVAVVKGFFFYSLKILKVKDLAAGDMKGGGHVLFLSRERDLIYIWR